MEFKLDTNIPLENGGYLNVGKKGNFWILVDYANVAERSTQRIEPYNSDPESLIYYEPPYVEVKLDLETCVPKT